MLRSQTRVLNALSNTPNPPSRHDPANDVLYPPSRAEIALRRKGHFIETAKDRWNAEIENAVRWAQTKDWDAVREDAEARILGVARVVPVPSSSEVKEGVKESVVKTGHQIKEDVVGAVHKGKEMVGRAKAAVYLAEERADSKVDAKLLHLSEMERALEQRYRRDDSVMKKSVQEVLAERYKPIGERDNTRLRGI